MTKSGNYYKDGELISPPQPKSKKQPAFMEVINEYDIIIERMDRCVREINEKVGLIAGRPMEAKISETGMDKPSEISVINSMRIRAETLRDISNRLDLIYEKLSEAV